jgi:hypothetical protein
VPAVDTPADPGTGQGKGRATGHDKQDAAAGPNSGSSGDNNGNQKDESLKNAKGDK